MGSGLEELGIVDDLEAEAIEAPPVTGRTMPPQPAVTGDTMPPMPPTAVPTAGADRRAREVAGEIDTAAMQADLQRLLRQVSLFEGLLPIHIKRIAGLVQSLDLRRGDAVFRHGDPGDGLYLIVSGAIRISRTVSGMGEEALAILRPGMYFGEMSIIDDDMPRSADAIAHEETRLLKLPKDDLRDLMFVDRELAYELLWRFVRTLSGRLRDSNDRLLMLTVSSKF